MNEYIYILYLSISVKRRARSLRVEAGRVFRISRPFGSSASRGSWRPCAWRGSFALSWPFDCWSPRFCTPWSHCFGPWCYWCSSSMSLNFEDGGMMGCWDVFLVSFLGCERRKWRGCLKLRWRVKIIDGIAVFKHNVLKYQNFSWQITLLRVIPHKWHLSWYILTFYLTSYPTHILTDYLTFNRTFYLAFRLTHSIWHIFSHFSWHSKIVFYLYKIKELE